MDVFDPQLWDVYNPNLYSIITVHVGFRSIRFDADNGFFLNGRNLKLKGICMHHEAGTLGSAVPRQVLER
jgi:beta-galactosidase/beta-glucuronidase